MRWAARTYGFVREAEWLTGGRAIAYCRILSGSIFLVAIGWLATSHGAIDPLGHPIGTDFLEFYAASFLALHGPTTAVYNSAVHHSTELALIGPGASTSDWNPFLYPPVFLLVCLPLACLPYLPSLFIWLSLTGYGYWKCVRRILKDDWAILPIISFPAVFINAVHGQNGFLTSTLFMGAASTMITQPIVAGVCFGGLIIKPHLAILVPIALIAARRWKTFGAAAATALLLTAISIGIFGLNTWRAFIADAPLAAFTLQQFGAVKMPSVFGTVLLFHGATATAYLVQLAATLGVAAALFFGLQHRSSQSHGDGALIAAAALAATPYLNDYDLVTLALPLAWVLHEALHSLFLPWEKAVLVGGFLLPLFCTPALHFGIPLGPPVLLAVFLIVLRRFLFEDRVASPMECGALLRVSSSKEVKFQ